MHLYSLLPNFPVSRFVVNSLPLTHDKWTGVFANQAWFTGFVISKPGPRAKHCQDTLTSWNIIMKLNCVYPKVRIRGLIKMAIELSHNKQKIYVLFPTESFTNKFDIIVISQS